MNITYKERKNTSKRYRKKRSLTRRTLYTDKTCTVLSLALVPYCPDPSLQKSIKKNKARFARIVFFNGFLFVPVCTVCESVVSPTAWHSRPRQVSWHAATKNTYLNDASRFSRRPNSFITRYTLFSISIALDIYFNWGLVVHLGF